MSAVLDRMRRQAVLLDQPAPGSTVVPLGDPGLLAEVRELAQHHAPDWKPRMARMMAAGVPQAAGGKYYQDTRAPLPSADMATITLSTTSLMLWPANVWTPTYPSDWEVGKLFHLRCFGKITTAATPGNLTIEIRYGTTDNGGTILATSAALTLVVSQTNISWRCEFYVQCRAVGSGTNGSLFATGVFECNTAVIAAGQALLPASAAAATGVDTTATSGINLQFKRSGSTVETATAQHPIFAALS